MNPWRLKDNLLSFHSIITILVILFAGCGPEKQPVAQQAPFPMVTGENLFAVSAPDSNNAWVVGFNAIIVHSCGGGAKWEIQNGGVTAPLYDVSFVNPQTGWIAGARGTILHTKDGGKNLATAVKRHQPPAFRD